MVRLGSTSVACGVLATILAAFAHRGKAELASHCCAGQNDELGAMKAQLTELQGKYEKALRATQDELRHCQGLYKGLRRDVDRHEAQLQTVPAERGPQARRLQTKPGEQGESLRLHKRKMTSSGFHPPSLDGHRRLQAVEKCDVGDLSVRSAALTKECCNEQHEDCSSGFPAVCNEGCADVVLTYWRDCSATLIKYSGPAVAAQFKVLIGKCNAAISTAQTLPLSTEFALKCDGAFAGKECVPPCDEELHGHVLLATVDGGDTSFLCETHNGLYSWVGSAGSGGYIGHDFKAFITAILPGAGGLFYLLSTENNADIGWDLEIRPYQQVRVRGDPKLHGAKWGLGGFIVAELAQLTLTDIAIGGYLNVEIGGVLSLENVTVNGTLKVTGTRTRMTNGKTIDTPENFFPLTWDSRKETNAAKKQYILVLLPPIKFSGTGDSKSYGDVCAVAGLRPIVSGWSPTDQIGVTKNGAPGYCVPWDCLPGDVAWGSSTFDELLDATGWDPSAGSLVVFSPCATATGACTSDKVAGGIMNSIGGFSDTNWDVKHRPVCGKEL